MSAADKMDARSRAARISKEPKSIAVHAAMCRTTRGAFNSPDVTHTARLSSASIPAASLETMRACASHKMTVGRHPRSSAPSTKSAAAKIKAWVMVNATRVRRLRSSTPKDLAPSPIR